MRVNVIYQLCLPVSTSFDEVIARVDELFNRAKQLPLQHVPTHRYRHVEWRHDLTLVRGEKQGICDGLSDSLPRELGIGLFLAEDEIPEGKEAPRCLLDPYRFRKHYDPAEVEWRNRWKKRWVTVLAEEAYYFELFPGDGCSGSIAFGLARWPKHQEYRAPATSEKFEAGLLESATSQPLPPMPDYANRWSMVSVFSSNLGDSPEEMTQALRCHLRVIALLDAAKASGFEIEVDDNGRYWELRDLGVLYQMYAQSLVDEARNVDALDKSDEGRSWHPIKRRSDYHELVLGIAPLKPAGMEKELAQLLELTQFE